MQEFLNQTFLGNSVYSYAVALCIFILGAVILTVFKKIILTKLKKWSEKTQTTLDDLLIRGVEKSILPVLYLILFYLAVETLTLHEEADKVLGFVTVILV